MSEERQEQEQKQEQGAKITKEDLDPYIPDKDYAEYYINVAKRTVRREDSFVRQVFYTALSKDSDDPLNLAVLAKTSDGKTYGITETLKYFRDKSIWYFGSMSPKVLIRQNGILVDSNYQPLKPRLKQLKKDIQAAKEREDDDELEALENKLDTLIEDAKILIELGGLCLVFLEPPHSETWNILKSTLSHDRYEIEHPYVYEDKGIGFRVKKVVTRGWPSCIFASARDESQWKVWPEIQSRFSVISPNVIPEKFQEGNILISQRKSLPTRMKRKVIVSEQQEEIANKCASYLMQHVKNNMNQDPDEHKDPFWIPYGLILGLALPSEKGTDNRTASRIFSYLRMVALVRSHLRCKMKYHNEDLVIPTIADLHETLHILQNVSGIPDHKLRMFKDYYWPCYQSKFEETKGNPRVSHDGKKQESVFGITNREFCEYYKEQTQKVLQTRNFRETYIEEWYNNGLVELVDSEIKKNEDISYPILMKPEETKEKEADNNNNNEVYDLDRVFKIGVIGDLAQSPFVLQPNPIVVQKNFKQIPQNWLELQLLGFFQLEIGEGGHSNLFDVCQMYDENNSKICVCQFFHRYRGNADTPSLNSYFVNGISHKNYKEHACLPIKSEPHEPKDCKIMGDWLKSPFTPVLNTIQTPDQGPIPSSNLSDDSDNSVTSDTSDSEEKAAKLRGYDRLSALARKKSKAAAHVGANENDLS